MLSLTPLSAMLISAIAGAGATPLPGAPETQVPDPLKPWVGWVLDGQGAARCPFLHGEQDATQCAWPSRLSLALDDRGGRFTQQWAVFAESWVALPGDAKRWPQDVRVDGAPAAVTETDGAPRVRLEPGQHTVAGAFAWDALPEALHVPKETGLLDLAVHGKPAPSSWDGEGQLWLQRQAAAAQEEDRLEVSVTRRIDDEIPLLLATHIELSVSGKSREVLLARVAPEGFVPLSLAAPLPARLEPDGRLRVQVRPGQWSLDLVARRDGPVTALKLAPPDGPWASEEIWAFSARTDLRQVTVEGVPGVDPQQTRLPEAWKSLPAYRVQPGDEVIFKESRRGDANPAPDQLGLQRTLWLDFNGGGYTVRDEITGTVNRSWRLSMPPPTQLGRVAIDGRDQLVTRLGSEAPAGVEIRQGHVSLQADSRIEGDIASVPAVSWDHDFGSVAAVLNLPPGWRLFHASGVDDVSATWLKGWTLLDLFLVLVISLAVGKLWRWPWGVVALVTLGLSFPESGAPRWVWLAMIAVQALARALPEGRLRDLARFFRLGVVAVLLCVVAVFLARQARAGLYPGLERPGATYQSDEVDRLVRMPASPSRSAPMEEDVSGLMSEKKEDNKTKALQRGWISTYSTTVDPSSAVQTGPGVPHWSWESVPLRWSGPVEAAQRIHLYLVPPWLNRAFSFLRVLLVALLAACVLGFPGSFWPKALKASAVAMLLLAACLAAPGKAGADEIPTDEMLQELQHRLLRKPACAPDCASSSHLALEIGPQSLRATLEVSAAAHTAIPLPGSAQQWFPAKVELDGKAAPALFRSADGQLWIELVPGAHHIAIEGPLPQREAVQLALPLKPHAVAAHAVGWRVEGIHEDGLADPNLQLTRIDKGGQGAESAAIQSAALPPFVRIERTLRLGLTWQVETHVIRVSPTGAAIVIDVPLLPGESVTTAEVRVAGGKALVNLAPQEAELSWQSALEVRPKVHLKAPAGVSWTEVWRLDASPVWHVALSGIPVIHQQDASGARLPEWRPWPGEEVDIEVDRPAGVAGQTFTIDQSTLNVTPGIRSTDASLSLSLRSSRGGLHTLRLPEGAQLQALAINGASQPVRQSDRAVTLPLVPGRQRVDVTWRGAKGIASRFVTPSVDLGAPSVNAETVVNAPRDRWVLLAGGGTLGPAVLFWGMILVLLVVSIGLGRLELTPLRGRHWFLLGLGFTQAPEWAAVIFAGWLLALGWRKTRGAEVKSGGWFNLGQILLALWTVVALASLVASVQQGLLGQPDMQIAGNGSTEAVLRWFHDRSASTLPQAWVISAPILVYRLAMLAWALWLALALLGWMRWGWGCFTASGLWRPRAKVIVPATAVAPGYDPGKGPS